MEIHTALNILNKETTKNRNKLLIDILCVIDSSNISNNKIMEILIAHLGNCIYKHLGKRIDIEELIVLIKNFINQQERMS